MLKIDRKKDNRVIRAFTHKVADIPNGITVSADDLTQKVLHEGTPVGKDENGLYHVVKVAVLTDDATNSATTYTVKKGHNFKVGDVLMLAPGGAAYAITAIATNSGDGSKDDLTVGTTLGVAAKAGDSLYLAYRKRLDYWADSGKQYPAYRCRSESQTYRYSVYLI